jgi:2-keto-4-pentenoate hydratase/2-oxohepta-3-ene-1,7-dioic acid hydratase in catechol pathway
LSPGGSIVIPSDWKSANDAGELVIVMGKRCRNVSVAQAKAAIFGYACGNDVSERGVGDAGSGRCHL